MRKLVYRHPRYRSELPVHVLGRNGQVLAQGHCIDSGEGGLSAELSGAIDCGDEVDLVLPGEDELLCVRARVVSQNGACYRFAFLALSRRHRRVDCLSPYGPAGSDRRGIS